MEERNWCSVMAERLKRTGATIQYVSLGLNDAETNYSSYECEGLEIVFSFKTFPHYLLCQKFKLFTDHESLKYVINKRDPYGKIAKWMIVFA